MGGYLAYTEYKGSGVKWLGKIPAHWQAKRFKFLISEPLKYGANEAAELTDSELPRYIRITDVKEDGTLREETFRSLPEDVAKEYLLEGGDILLARSGATVGKTFIYQPSWGKAAYAGYLIRARTSDEVDSKFIYQFLQSNSYWEWVKSIFIQATIQNISAEKYANLYLPIPPVEEQRSIARFLDYKTAQIDALIAKKEALLEKLAEKRTALISQAVTKGCDQAVPMKDSGIEWLGEIPEHWRVIPLRYACEFLNRKRIPLSAEERGSMVERIYPYYGASGIIDYVEDFIFEEPTILIAEDGANLLSRSTPLAFIAKGQYWVNNHAHILKPLKGPFEYWASLLCVLEYNPWITGAAQPKLTKENLGGIHLPFPPEQEQEQICHNISKQSAKIDPMIERVKQAIARLKEYRTALITNAVTGKIDVRDIKLPELE